jgi:hypothetical protein
MLLQDDTLFMVDHTVAGISMNHISGTSLWQIADGLATVEQQRLVTAMQQAAFGAVTIDESDSVSIIEYLGVEICAVAEDESFERATAFGALLPLQRMDALSIKGALIQFLTKDLDFSDIHIASKLVVFESDGAAVMSGDINGVGTLLAMQHAPFALERIAQPTVLHCQPG